VYGLSKETVSRQISKLAQHGFIHVHIIYFEDSKQIKERRIYLTKSSTNESPAPPIDVFADTPIDENEDTPIGNFADTPIDENVKENNRTLNIKKKNSTSSNNIIKSRQTSAKKNEPEEETLTADADNDADFIPVKKSKDNSADSIAVYDYGETKKKLQKNIRYFEFIEHNKKHNIHGENELIDELLNCMLDVICTDKAKVKINGDLKPREMVIDKYLSVTASEIQHIIGKFKEQIGKITHVNSYLKTLLYTVKQENNFFYENAVREKGFIK
jgi:hypothetical protein